MNPWHELKDNLTILVADQEKERIRLDIAFQQAHGKRDEQQWLQMTLLARQCEAIERLTLVIGAISMEKATL